MASSPTTTCCVAWNGAGDKKEQKQGKCELIGYEALPDWLKDNEFIHGYYRCEWPMKETILSISSIHNETLNVWSHLIGFLLFLCLTIFTAMVIPRDSSSSSWSSGRSSAAYWGDLVEMANMTVALRHEALAACFLLPPPAAAAAGLSEDGQQIPASCPPNTSSSHRHHGIQIQDTTGTAMDELAAADPITRWPLFAYLAGAMLCLLTSSACHLILCHSERTAYVTLRLDYAGIAALIVTSFYPLAYYSFLCDPALQRLYMGSITALGAAAVTVSLVPAFQAPELRPLRAALFTCMGASGVVPIAHKLVLYGGTAPGAVATAGYEALMVRSMGSASSSTRRASPRGGRPGDSTSSGTATSCSTSSSSPARTRTTSPESSTSSGGTSTSANWPVMTAWRHARANTC